MTPVELSKALNRIASKIDASSNPSRDLVLQDLKSVVASMERTGGLKEEAAFLALIGTVGIGLNAQEVSQMQDLRHRTDMNVQVMERARVQDPDGFVEDIADKFGLIEELNETKSKSAEVTKNHKLVDAHFLALNGVELVPYGQQIWLTKGGLSFVYDPTTGKMESAKSK